MKFSVYDILDGKKALIFEQIKEGEHVTYFKDYQADPVLEMTYTFDGEHLREEVELEDGREISKCTYAHNRNGDLVKSAAYIEGELFEETDFVKQETGEIATTTVDGEETRKMISSLEDGINKQEFFEDGDLTQVRLEEEHDTEKASSIKVYDGHGNFIGGGKEFKNDVDKTIKIENYNAYGEIELMVEYHYNTENQIEQLITTDFTNGKLVYRTNFAYSKDKVSKVDVYNEREELVECHERFFNAENQVIEEKGFSNGLFNGFDRPYIQSAEYHVQLEHVSA